MLRPSDDEIFALREILQSGFAHVREFNRGTADGRDFAEREIAKAKSALTKLLETYVGDEASA
jgi:hypothetical protein